VRSKRDRGTFAPFTERETTPTEEEEKEKMNWKRGREKRGEAPVERG